MHLLKNYEALLDLSIKMEGLAREQAWDALTQTESERSKLLARMAAPVLSSLATADQRAVAAMIQKIQCCDQAVRDHVLPWQDSVRTLLTRLEPKL